MKPRRRRSSRFGNPLGLSKTPVKLPKSRVSTTKIPASNLPTFNRRRRDLFRFNPFRKPFSWKRVGIWAAATVGVFFLMVTSVFAYYVRELPNPHKIETRAVAQSTKILDRNRKELFNIHGEENRTLVNGDQISEYSKKATIAIEDANFYDHHGFSVRGVARAVWCRVRRNCVAGGGSTITQQYIKNALLKDPSQTLDRKLKELILSIEIEQIYSKDEILTGYLNEIPYGGNAYGIEAAAQTYFNKHAKDLTLSEAATLAAIPQAPTYYSPYGNHLDRLFVRKNYILDRMVKVGSITKAQAEEAKTATPNLESPVFAQPNLKAPHFVFYVREKLIDLIDSDPQTAEQKLDRGGYTVTTSLDLETQEMAQAIVADMGPNLIKKYHASNAALVAVDPKSGEVIAMVGSISYTDSKSGNTNFANALLQPGSSFKPFVYASTFGPEIKRHPGSITYDLQTDFGNYTPHNYDFKFRGPITNRNALAQSLNIPAVKNLYIAGIGNSIDTAKKLGITTLTKNPNDYGLSLVLGSGEVRPVEMASAYGTFANGGMHQELRPIMKIEQNGKVIKDFTKNTATKAIEPEVAWQVSSILSDNGARTPVFGSRNSLTLPDRPVAAKTGTTNNNRDAWTVGYTPQISVAVWVGNNEAKQTMTSGADGSYVAAPIWNRFMREYLKGKPVEEFKRPESMKEVAIDMLSGKLPGDQSPPDQRVTEWMAPWQIPTEPDDVHVKVKIDKSTGKLATDLTPADQIEERYYFSVHSEEPNLPNWEEPVQAWAREHGAGQAPPSEKDDLHTATNQPTLTFNSPSDNGTVSGSFLISVQAGGNYPITKVEFNINGTSVGSRTEAPWNITYTSDNLPAGTSVIQAKATNSLGLTSTAQISVGKGATVDTTPPGPVSSLQKTDGSRCKPIRLTWINPSNSDLTHVVIYSSNSPGQLGNRIQTVPVSPGTPGSADVVGFSPDPTPYYLTVRTVDTSNNESSNGPQIAALVSRTDPECPR